MELIIKEFIFRYLNILCSVRYEKNIIYEKFKFDVFLSKSIYVGLFVLRLKVVIGCFLGIVII